MWFIDKKVSKSRNFAVTPEYIYAVPVILIILQILVQCVYIVHAS